MDQGSLQRHDRAGLLWRRRAWALLREEAVDHCRPKYFRRRQSQRRRIEQDPTSLPMGESYEALPAWPLGGRCWRQTPSGRGPAQLVLPNPFYPPEGDSGPRPLLGDVRPRAVYSATGRVQQRQVILG